MTRADLGTVAELARQLRVDAIRMSTHAGSGHPSSSLSAADLMAVLLARHLRRDWQRPRDPVDDHLVFSKGHATPLLYAMFKAAGVVSDDQLMAEYRRPGSAWQGHPTPALSWVDVATGSLGQGLPDAVGIALAARDLDKAPARVWVLCGDSEMAEGSMWEAFDKASHFRLANLTTIVDINGLGMRGSTALGWNLDLYAARIAAFGCRPIVVDGHDLSAIDCALAEAAKGDVPAVVLARTHKGRGFSGFEDASGWHGKPLPRELAEAAIAELGGERSVPVKLPEPRAAFAGEQRPLVRVRPPEYTVGAAVATRRAFGETLAALGARPEVVVLDGDVGNSTNAELFAQVYPDRYFDVYTAEQQMIAAAIGFSVRGYVPFAATFGAFLTRAHDFIRMAAVSQANLRLVGTHAGVEVGPDGSSQMALEDLAMMRAVHGSTVLYPSDATSTAHLVIAMAEHPGISYLRATRGTYQVLYGLDETFPLGGSKTLRETDHDEITLIGAGITVHESLIAADELARWGIKTRVVDLYCVKPVDVDTLVRAARDTGRLVVTEDHRPEGGLGETVLAALNDAGTPARLAHLAVRDMPGSGEPWELVDRAGIAGRHIAAAARRMIEQERAR
jgi:transketolase